MVVKVTDEEFYEAVSKKYNIPILELKELRQELSDAKAAEVAKNSDLQLRVDIAVYAETADIPDGTGRRR